MIVEILNILAPVFIIILLGFILGKFIKINKDQLKLLTNLLIFVLVPALVFTSTLKNTIGHTTLLIIIFAMVIISIMGIISSIVTRFLKLDEKTKSGFMLTAMFMNSGSMGSVICLILFGEDGFLLAIMFYITSQILLYTMGVIIASQHKKKLSLGALKPIFTLPLIYALIIGLTFHYFNVQISGNILMPITLLSNAAVPILLITLGMQLSRIRIERSALQLPALNSSLRIGAGFAIAFVLTSLIGITGIERNVIVICAAMPSKITSFPIASKFGSNSEHVSMTILLSTLISIITTPLVLLSLGIF
jgi:predicted permease